MQAAPLGLKTQVELGFVKITSQYGTQNNIKTKNKFLSELSYDYKFTEKFAFNYLFGYKLDDFSTFDSQLYTGPGLKYIVLASKTQNLNLAVNILYSQDNSNIAGVETQDYASYRLALNYDWQILENLKFTQELNYRSDIEDFENYFVNMENLGSKNTDKIITANLIINF